MVELPDMNPPVAPAIPTEGGKEEGTAGGEPLETKRLRYRKGSAWERQPYPPAVAVAAVAVLVAAAAAATAARSNQWTLLLRDA